MIDQAEAVLVRQAHGGEVLTRHQATGLLHLPPLPQPAVAAEVGGLVGMPAPVPAAISRTTLGSALGVDNNAGGINGIKVAHAMPLHIGGGEMVQQHTRRRRRPAGPAPRTGDRGPAYPSLAVSAVPVAASAPAASAVPVAAPAPNRECAARHAIP